MKWRSAAVLPLVAAVLAGCTSKSPSPAGSGGGTAMLDSGGATLDDGVVDASTAPMPEDASPADPGADGGGNVTLAGCGVKRAASAAACADACDARLALPGGGSFCTVQCGQDSDCGGPGAELLCPSTVGACVPRCTADASCKTSGFLRCDTDTGGCDTL